MSAGWMMFSWGVLAQAATGGGGFPILDVLIVVACIGGAGFAICRSANRR